jgi:hypothetical protein
MRINRLLIAGIVSIGLLASCASESTAPESSGPATIKLTLSAGATRTGGSTGTAVPTGDGTIANSSSDEAKLNRVSVVTFDGNSPTSKVVTIQEITSPSGTNTITTTTAAKYIAVFANAPTNYFSGKTTLLDVTTKATDLGYTTSSDGNTANAVATVNSQTVTALPMSSTAQLIGTGTLAANSSTAVTANLVRMVSRISMTSIATSFENAGAYAGASFVPKEIFIYNGNTTDNWDNTMPSPASFQSGESTDGTGTNPSLTNYSYLSSGSISLSSAALSPAFSSTATELSYLKTTANPSYFYVFPNTSSSATSTATATKIVIKGLWTFGASVNVPMYYPILINHAQTGTSFVGTPGTDTQVAPNTRYAMSVVIRSIGVSSPASNIDPASVNLTLTVQNWGDLGQTTVVN